MAEVAQFLTLKDLCQRLKLSQGMIFKLMKSGAIPQGVKFGRVRRWTVNEIEQWAQAQAAGN